jgi:hypothetical protein
MIRTVQLIGNSFSAAGDLSAVIKIDNQVVYDGVLTTTAPYQLTETGGPDIQPLASWQQDFGLVYPMADEDTFKTFSLEISGGDAYSGITFAGLKTSNYMGYVDDINKEYCMSDDNQFDFPSRVSNREDGKFNVKIDGIDQMWRRTNEFYGPWVFSVYSGSVLTCDYQFLKIVTPDSSYTRVYDPPGGSYFDPVSQTRQILKKYCWSEDSYLVCESQQRCALLGTPPGSGVGCPGGNNDFPTCQFKEWTDHLTNPPDLGPDGAPIPRTL